ncbi:F0F1 ATP synthase subunit B' [Emcibacter nanhaiensis]|uniref:ATP synthase subunit b n=1 Tax=Emcibacter nanhaiensis TaxID=1505037 RepID=A0A501PC35_9PROT|nr:F0F1 ATP synthase subunit B' [Emcibacter nanhaiensis]TPD57651.1 F0F1 ATP synthase subunit B' [Emcibacter nanhaiensis]
MPQLDPAVFAPQIFWLAIVFAVLYLIMHYSIVPKVSDVLEKRQNRIANDLEEAEKLQREAEEARIAYEKALQEARDNATSTIAAKREAIKLEVEAKYNELSQKLNVEAEEAAGRILAAKEKAMEDVRTVSADLCKDIVARVAKLELDDAAIGKAVEGKLADAVKEKANG